MNRKAIIFGIKGFSLTRHEKIFIKKTKPWGIIIFSRNIKDIDQLKNLISEIKKILNVKKYPILIDQEGGKVSRLNKIIDLSLFSQSYFAKLFFIKNSFFHFFPESDPISYHRVAGVFTGQILCGNPMRCGWAGRRCGCERGRGHTDGAVGWRAGGYSGIRLIGCAHPLF